ncbi:MAG: hypothetical protein AAF664_25430, partial [Planctomycetota bacterium]
MPPLEPPGFACLPAGRTAIRKAAGWLASRIGFRVSQAVTRDCPWRQLQEFDAGNKILADFSCTV